MIYTKTPFVVQFSETSLGRFFQAVELYILVLYVHIASFYERRTRLSISGPRMKNLANDVSLTVDDTKRRERISTFQTIPATASVSRDMAGDITPRGTPYSRHNDLSSSWPISERDLNQDSPRRLSPMSRLASLITGRRNSAGVARASRVWTYSEVESGTPPLNAKASFTVTPANQRLGGNTLRPDAPSFGIRNGHSPDGTIASFAAVENYRRDDLASPTKISRLPGSPVYGLNGIIRYHGQSTLSRPSSVQSSGMESLLRQQAERDQSVTELQSFSPDSVAPGEKPIVSEELSSSIRSDFSLSHFPNPPPSLPCRLSHVDVSDVSRLNASNDKRAQQAMSQLSIISKPRICQPGQRQSFPSSNERSSTDDAVLRVASRTILGSGAYDVTSFIGS